MVERVESTDSTDKDPRIESVIGDRYRIERKIGSGGMGVVYKAERLELSKPVAVKFLQEFFVANSTFLARFKRETKAMSKLSHPNCVSVIDVGVAGAPYIVMEYVEGTTLKDLIEAERFTIARAVRTVSQILAGMAHAHSQGIIHRDIKPANVMMCKAEGLGEQARIFDFGLAKLLDTTDVDAAVTAAAGLLGTPDYMSPEQSRGKNVDQRTDIYAAGVVLFELLAGSKPFVGEQAFDVLKQHRETLPPRIKDVDINAMCSFELEEVVRKALEKVPDDRFQSASDFFKALQATPEGAELIQDSPIYTSREPKPQKIPILIIAGVVITALLIFFVIRFSDDSKPEISKQSVGDTGQGGESSGKVEEPDTGSKEDIAISLKEIQKLLENGELDAAMEGLKKLRIEKPEDPYVACLLGNVYFEKKWWADALERYNLAINLDESYRGNKDINNNVIQMLGGEKLPRRVLTFIVNTLGKSALPFLEHASKKDDNPRIRRRARAISKEIEGK